MNSTLIDQPERTARSSFSALSDPIDIARVYAAVETAWKTLQARRFASANAEREREMLLDIAASNVLMAANDHDLVRRSVEGFLTNRNGA